VCHPLRGCVAASHDREGCGVEELDATFSVDEGRRIRSVEQRLRISVIGERKYMIERVVEPLGGARQKLGWNGR
jgi:hypothetical protein